MPTLIKIPLNKVELALETTLQCGQSFRWKRVSSDEWRGVINNYIWTLRQNKSILFCMVHNEKDVQEGQLENVTCSDPSLKNKYVQIITDYFQLNICLKELYSYWSNCDKNFSSVSKKFPGIRLINQDPVENVFSFICSSNNNIERITLLVNKLCENFGQQIGTVDEQIWYSFPNVSQLAAKGTEEKLRLLGFGYRAKYIHHAAVSIMNKGGDDWLYYLRSLNYEKCRSELKTLTGIGPKVADCICLMSMGHHSSIPVDTHVFQVATKNYLPHLKNAKSVTDSVYKEIANHFRDIFGDKAGWAHSILFCSDLRKFSGKNDSKQKKR